MTTPIEFLREATKAVPAIKYAMGVGGIIATIAIIYSFKIDPRVAFVGTIVMFLLMGVLVLFARMASLSGTRLASPALVFAWFTLLIFMAVSIALFTSVFFKKPLDLNWLTGPASTPLPPTTSPAKDQLNAEQRYELIKLAQNGCYFFVPGEAKIYSVTDYIELAQKELADSLAAPETAIQVEGYVETGYSQAYALKLSERRAQAVKQILVARYGLDATHIYTEGHGMNHNQKWVREYFCGARISRSR